MFAGFGTAERDQRALPLPARARADRPLHRLRHADADGLRLATSRAPRRGRPRGRRRRHLADMRGPVRRHPARAGHGVDDHQRAGGDRCSRCTSASPSSRASTAEALGGTIQNDILKEFIAQKEWIFPPEPSMRLVTDMIEFCTERHAAVEPDLDQRLPHPRGRLDRRAGAGLHPGRRLRLRRVRPRARPGRRRLRAAALVLLQRPQRLLRGDRQVPRGPRASGPRDARALRRAQTSARC